MRLPDFVIIGAQKSGTTWLYRMLSQHPDVFTSEPKQVHFFDTPRHYERGLPWYASHFTGAGERKAGEFTANYFWTGDDAPAVDGRTLPERVGEVLPDARLVVVLREPVDRAISAYYHHIRARRIRPTQSILDVKDDWGIFSMGTYDEHLERWLAVYPRDQLLVLLYEEDINDGRQRTLDTVCDFLDVPRFQARFAGYKYNPRKSQLFMRLNFKSPRLARWADRLLPGVVKNHPRFEIPVTDEEKAALRALYAPHNARLAEQLGRSLPW